MSWAQWIVSVGVGWTLLGLIIGIWLGPILREIGEEAEHHGT